MSLRIEQDGRFRRIALAAVENAICWTRRCARICSASCGTPSPTPRWARFAGGGRPDIRSGEVDPWPGEELFTIGRRMVKPLVAAVQGVAISGRDWHCSPTRMWCWRRRAPASG